MRLSASPGFSWLFHALSIALRSLVFKLLQPWGDILPLGITGKPSKWTKKETLVVMRN